MHLRTRRRSTDKENYRIAHHMCSAIALHPVLANAARDNVKKEYPISGKKQCNGCGYILLRYIRACFLLCGHESGANKLTVENVTGSIGAKAISGKSGDGLASLKEIHASAWIFKTVIRRLYTRSNVALHFFMCGCVSPFYLICSCQENITDTTCYRSVMRCFRYYF